MSNYLNCKKIWTAIERAKKMLIAQAKQNGIYENFGQKEVREIKEKFIDITDFSERMNNNRIKLEGFHEWCMNYRGENNNKGLRDMRFNTVGKNKEVIMTKGDFKKQKGKWLGISGYTNGHGAVCKINIAGTIHEFTSDFFKFTDSDIQAKWEDDSIDFIIDM